MPHLEKPDSADGLIDVLYLLVAHLAIAGVYF